MPPATIADTDGPGLQCVLEQMEKGREGRREGGKCKQKMQKHQNPSGSHGLQTEGGGPKSGQRKVRLKLASGSMLMLGGMEG